MALAVPPSHRHCLRPCLSHPLETLKGPCFKDLVPRVAFLGDDRTFERWGLMGHPLVIEGVPMKWTMGPQSLSLSLFASWPQFCYVPP